MIAVKSPLHNVLSHWPTFLCCVYSLWRDAKCDSSDILTQSDIQIWHPTSSTWCESCSYKIHCLKSLLIELTHSCHAGRLPMSMTHAYSQEVTEESHTALVRNRLLQQMEASSTSDLQHLASRRSPSSAQSVPQTRFADAEGCLKPPLRGSGHHHYLPSAGEHDCHGNETDCCACSSFHYCNVEPLPSTQVQ